MNRRQAIRERCLDCSGFSPKAVRECEFTHCELYPYRMGTGKQDPQKRDKAIRDFCLDDCMNGERNEVSLCPSEDCPLYLYRNTGAKSKNKPYRTKIPA